MGWALVPCVRAKERLSPKDGRKPLSPDLGLEVEGPGREPAAVGCTVGLRLSSLYLVTTH